MADHLQRGLWPELAVRFSYVSCADTVTAALVAHGCDPLSGHVLARALGAGLLSSPLLGEGERYTLRWNYAGAIKTVLLNVEADGRTRGFIAPATCAERVETEDDIYGEGGKLTVIKSAPHRTLNTGLSEAPLADVVDDLAFFFSTSDQIETVMSVWVAFAPDPARPVRFCRGIMLQALPGCDLALLDRMRGRLGSDVVRGLLGAFHAEQEASGPLLAALSASEAGGDICTIHPGPAPRFLCSCSKAGMVQVVRTLPAAERHELLRGKGEISVTCEFCSTRHLLSRTDVDFGAARPEQD